MSPFDCLDAQNFQLQEELKAKAKARRQVRIAINLFEPYAEQWCSIVGPLSEMSDRKLQALLRNGERLTKSNCWWAVTKSNCWWATYQIWTRVMKPEIERELQVRKYKKELTKSHK